MLNYTIIYCNLAILFVLMELKLKLHPLENRSRQTIVSYNNRHYEVSNCVLPMFEHRKDT